MSIVVDSDGEAGIRISEAGHLEIDGFEISQAGIVRQDSDGSPLVEVDVMENLQVGVTDV